MERNAESGESNPFGKISSLVVVAHNAHSGERRTIIARRLVFAFKMPPPNTKGVGLAKVWTREKQRETKNRQREQRQHSSKTFTIDSDGDEDDENDYEDDFDDSDDDDGRGNDDDNDNNQKRKKSSKRALNNVARAYQHEKKKKKFYYYAQQRDEFSVCRFLLVAIAITFALIFLVEQFAPKDVYIHRSMKTEEMR